MKAKNKTKFCRLAPRSPVSCASSASPESSASPSAIRACRHSWARSRSRWARSWTCFCCCCWHFSSSLFWRYSSSRKCARASSWANIATTKPSASPSWHSLWSQPVKTGTAWCMTVWIRRQTASPAKRAAPRSRRSFTLSSWFSSRTSCWTSSSWSFWLSLKCTTWVTTTPSRNSRSP